MQRMGEAFVLGRDIDEALRKADRGSNRAFRYSFDMLGEGARTAPDAAAYLESYRRAIAAVGAQAKRTGDVFAARQRLGEALGSPPALRAVEGLAAPCPNSPAW